MEILMAELLQTLLHMGIFTTIFFAIVFISGRITSGGVINSKYTLITMCKEIKKVVTFKGGVKG